MKATVETLVTPARADRSRVAVYAELVKARLSFLVLLTTSVGFYLGSRGAVDFPRMFHLLVGTALIAGAAAALNQLMERDLDARMRRTHDRPLPAGRLQPESVLAFGAVSAVLGLACLALLVNPLTSFVGAVTLILYLFVYTPLKRVTWLNTVVGAVPGALPPLMGWAAARNAISAEALALFAIQFLWQVPHFLAIAWMYRDDYAQAGFRMLPVVDDTGRKTGHYAVAAAGLLGVASLMPAALGISGLAYLGCAVVLGAGFAGAAAQFARRLTLEHSRRLFWMSILYLPLLLGMLVWDKVKL